MAVWQETGYFEATMEFPGVKTAIGEQQWTSFYDISMVWLVFLLGMWQLHLILWLFKKIL